MTPRSRSRARFAALVALAFGLTACGPDGRGHDADADPVPGTEVAVVDNAFEPGTLQVEAGQTITWTWQGDSPHDVAFDDVASDLQRNGTYTHTFEDPGEFDYVCTVHGNMTGTIVVVAP